MVAPIEALNRGDAEIARVNFRGRRTLADESRNSGSHLIGLNTKLASPWLATTIAGAILFPYLGSVPGLHGDEAWTGLRAFEILHGLRPLLGMNEYTGPFHQYLVAGIFQMVGISVTSLRLMTAVTFLLTVPLYFRISKLFFDEWTATSAVLLLV